MPRERLSMRKIREVLRLKWGCGLSNRAVAASCGMGCTTVREYVQRAVRAGLCWPLPEGLDDAALEARLFEAPTPSKAERPLPDWKWVHKERTRKGVTLELLWQEYKADHPDGYQYTQFCHHYRQWAKPLPVTMRQDHKAGEKLFVDYAGMTMPVVNRCTGEVRPAQVFVAASGASNYTFAESTWTQTLPDWIASHQRAFRFFGGLHEIIVPDNLRSGVSKACRYEPELNPTYAEMAQHYGVAVVPTRAAKPQDKAKVEKAVQDIERRVLAPLRNRTFFSLGALNRALAERLEAFNNRSFQKLDGTRRTLFDELEKPVLRPLPLRPYDYAQWKKATVNIDYHVDAEGHYYSVPYTLVRQKVWVRIGASTVEVFHNHKRVASHVRSQERGRHTTVTAHMPKNHRDYQDWSPQRLVNWARKSGPATAQLIERILSSRRHPQQGYRSCLGIMRLGKAYGYERLEAACKRALAVNATSYKSIDSILKNGLDKTPLPEPVSAPEMPRHENVRGAGYYQTQHAQGEPAPCSTIQP